MLERLLVAEREPAGPDGEVVRRAHPAGWSTRWTTFLVARDAHHAREALHDLVVGRPPGPGPVLPEAGDGAGDDARVARRQHGVVEPEPGHHARADVLEHDVGAVAVPVIDASGRLRGALSVSTLLTRLVPDAETAMVAELSASADRLRRTLPVGG